MLRSELSIGIVNPEAGFDQPPEEPRSSAIPSSLHLYRLEMNEYLARHTGSANKFLDVEREQELATAVQAGRFAQSLRDENQTEYLANQEALDAQILAGGAAETVLVEANLRYAASLARASMNIFAPRRTSEDDDFEHPDVSTSKIGRNKPIRTFIDITELSSRYAELDARIQVANRGLMRAAADFKPTAGESGTPIRFTTYAAWKIMGELARYVKVHETPGWYVPNHIAEAITKGRKDPAEMTDKLRGIDAGRYTVPLESLEFAETDVEDEEEPTDILGIADLVQDEYEDVESDALAFGPVKVIDEALKQLATIKEIPGEKPADREKRQAVASRKAAVIAMRFGISDDPDKYGQRVRCEDIGEEFGVTPMRIRQIEARALIELRQILGEVSLEDILGSTARPTAGSYLPAGKEHIGNVRTGRTPAYGGRDVQGPAVRLDMPADLEAYRGSEVYPQESAADKKLRRLRELQASIPEPAPKPQPLIFSQTLSERHDVPGEPWQAYPGEPFDLQEALGQDQAERYLSQEVVANEFRDYLFAEAPDLFLEYFRKDLPTDYPVLLVNAVDQRFGRSLTAEHIERFWNTYLETFVNSFGDTINEKSLSTLCSYFSRLLAERMIDQSTIELRIPESLNGKLNYLGAWITNGRLSIRGNTGDFTGYKMGDLGSVTVHGSAGNFAGVLAGGYSELQIKGNAGHFFGGQARGSSSLIVHGSVGDYCGEGMNGDEVGILVGGNAGHEIASDALRGEITVRGSMSSIAASRSPRVTILTFVVEDQTPVPGRSSDSKRQAS